MFHKILTKESFTQNYGRKKNNQHSMTDVTSLKRHAYIQNGWLQDFQQKWQLFYTNLFAINNLNKTWARPQFCNSICKINEKNKNTEI